MAPEFDPYYKWLGIPPKDQPPNHYRLLSTEQLEDDSEVIDSAANRLMSHIHKLASGDRPAASQTSPGEQMPPPPVALYAQMKQTRERRRSKLMAPGRQPSSWHQGLRANLLIANPSRGARVDVRGTYRLTPQLHLNER